MYQIGNGRGGLEDTARCIWGFCVIYWCRCTGVDVGYGDGQKGTPLKGKRKKLTKTSGESKIGKLKKGRREPGAFQRDRGSRPEVGTQVVVLLLQWQQPFFVKTRTVTLLSPKEEI